MCQERIYHRFTKQQYRQFSHSTAAAAAAAAAQVLVVASYFLVDWNRIMNMHVTGEGLP
jgi:hypothetical protein